MGNVMVLKGQSGVRAHDPNGYPDQATDEQSNGRKGWVCVVSNFLNMTGCSTHLTAKTAPSGIRETQLWEYSSVINTYISAGYPLWACGDLNLQWNTSTNANSMFNNWWYALMKEADTFSLAPSAKRVTTDNGGSPNPNSAPLRIDYIFRRNPNSVYTDPYIHNSGNSDHHWYQMYNN